MRIDKIALLSVLLSGLGCSFFFDSEPDSPGANAPILYGTGPGPSGLAGSGGSGGAGSTGTTIDAAVPISGGIGGRADASIDATIIPDAGKPTPDAALHTGAQRWIRFPSYPFSKCTWFSPTDGYCSYAPAMSADKRSQLVNLFQTIDGGKNWLLYRSINTENTIPEAAVNVYVMSPTDLWFISGNAGTTSSGSIGHSTNGGLSWTSLTSTITALLKPATGDAGTASNIPIWQLASLAGRIWVLAEGGILAYSQDNGLSWKRLAAPTDFAAATRRSLIVSQGFLLLQFLAADNSMGLYRWNGAAFMPVEGTFPESSAGDQAGTWWQSSPNMEGVLFVDRGPLPAWVSPFWLTATMDGGRTFQKISDASLGTVAGLSDALAYSFLGSITAYAGGIFTDSSRTRYLEIHKTSDAGKTWSPVHSEPYLGDIGYISLSTDPSGSVHAMHYSLDAVTSAISYDAHYVLP